MARNRWDVELSMRPNARPCFQAFLDSLQAMPNVETLDLSEVTPHQIHSFDPGLIKPTVPIRVTRVVLPKLRDLTLRDHPDLLHYPLQMLDLSNAHNSGTLSRISIELNRLDPSVDATTRIIHSFKVSLGIPLNTPLKLAHAGVVKELCFEKNDYNGAEAVGVMHDMTLKPRHREDRSREHWCFVYQELRQGNLEVLEVSQNEFGFDIRDSASCDFHDSTDAWVITHGWHEDSD